MTSVPLPQFTDSVDLRYFIEPLNAPTAPIRGLDRFPDSLYVKTPDSHFVRFMTALLGPVGVGWLKFNLTVARLQLEATGLQQANLESFYGDPFSFGRILEEGYEDDVTGLLPIAAWQAIQAQDQAYRSRAIQFLSAARLGTSPQGMRLAAASGIGQNCEIIENYRYLFDIHSDDPLGLPFYGSSTALGEFIVVPRPAVSQTRQYVIEFGQASLPLGANMYTISFNGSSQTLDPTTTLLPFSGKTATDVQFALWQFASIGPGNVSVTGGPVPSSMTLTFTGALTNQALPPVRVSFTDVSSGTVVEVPIDSIAGGVDPSNETVVIADADRHAMQTALDELRPVASYPTFNAASSTLRPVLWSDLTASTEYSTVVRYVTGSPSVNWPTPDSDHWIVASQETEAPQLSANLAQHYVNFHNIQSITAYTDTALSDPAYATNSAVLSSYNSVHVGPFPEMSTVLPFFAQYAIQYSLVFSADRALADYTEPLSVTGLSADGTAFINNIYPADYTSLQGVPQLRYRDDAFWSSQARPTGAEILEIDLGTPQAVNFITFETTRKPVNVEADYDLLDQSPKRTFAPVVNVPGFPLETSVFFDPSQGNPWEPIELYFNDGQDVIFTRFIRLIFTRRPDSTTFGRFLFDTSTQTQTPWSIDVRNLRIGRNVAPSVT